MRMLYPLDVHQKTADAGKLAAKDKTNFIIMMTVIANVALFFFLSQVFRNMLGLGIGWALLVQLVLIFIIGSGIFRFVIFDENEKVREFKGYGKDSIAPYYNIRKDVEDTIQLDERRSVNIFEYSNGSLLACVQIRYGSNNDRKAEITRDVFESVFKLLCNYDFEFRTYTMTENFEETDEYKRYIRKLNNISDTNVSKYMLDIAETVLKESQKLSNVNVTYIQFRTRRSIQKMDMEIVVKSLINELIRGRTAFRSVEFLDKQALVNFNREYYGLEVLDLSMIKAIKPDMDMLEDYLRLIKEYSIDCTDGTRFVNHGVLEKYMPSLAQEVNFDD